MQKATFPRKYTLQDLDGYKIEIFSRSTSAKTELYEMFPLA